MGEYAKPGMLWWVLPDGTDGELKAKPLHCGEFTLDRVEAVDDVPLPNPFKTLDGFSVEVKSKHLRCQSRRRLVKLLMGQGRSRNESNRIARQCRERGIPYKREWFLRFFDGGTT